MAEYTSDLSGFGTLLVLVTSNMGIWGVRPFPQGHHPWNRLQGVWYTNNGHQGEGLRDPYW